MRRMTKSRASNRGHKREVTEGDSTLNANEIQVEWMQILC